MAEFACYCLMGILAWLIYVGFRFSIKDQDGARPLVSVNGVLLVKRVTGRVHPNERLAGFDLVQERLFIWKRQNAGCVGEDETIED